MYARLTLFIGPLISARNNNSASSCHTEYSNNRAKNICAPLYA